MMSMLPHLFADVTRKLEDLHAIAVEGQCSDNTPDMQGVLNRYLRSSLLELNAVVRAMTHTLDRGGR